MGARILALLGIVSRGCWSH